MIIKTFTYKNYNDVEVTDTRYFDFNEAEVLELEMTTPGGLKELLQKIVDAKDIPSLVAFWKSFILKAYGEKSADGMRFEKNEQITAAFSQTKAYSMLFMELATNTDAAIAFVNGVIPAGMLDGNKALPATKNN